MAPYSDDEFESDVDEDIVAAEPSEAEMPRVSPATKLKPMPRVYQPVYPASPMTIAGGVSPNVSPSPGKSPGTNVFRDDETRRSGASGENEEEAEKTASTETSARDVSASRGSPEHIEFGPPVTTEASIDPTPAPTTKDKPPRARWVRPEAPPDPTIAKRPTRSTEYAPRRARVSARSTNPVEMRRELLALRRREAAANAPRTPGEARAARGKLAALTAGDKKNAVEKNQKRASVARDARGALQTNHSAVPASPVRVVRADLQSGAPIFSRRAADALEASGARDFLVEDEEDKTTNKNKKRGPSCFVATAETERGGTYSAARGCSSPYAPVPLHRTYAWYKQFGFAGKGAASSWGFNPKRNDLFVAYAKAKATRENPRRNAPPRDRLY
jgi:hypothetical protein